MRLLTLLLPLFFLTAAPPFQRVSIQTNAVCDNCERNIEKALAAVEGVQKADLHLESKIAYVTFDPDVTDLAALRQAISQAGYRADGVKADPEALSKLTGCSAKAKTGSAAKSRKTKLR